MSAQSWKVGEHVHGVDYYELLGVSRTASAAEIKSAYRTLARTMHPDVGGTTGTFRLLREAYETLNDPVRRAVYDRAAAGPAPDTGHSRAAPRTSEPEPSASRSRSQDSRSARAGRPGATRRPGGTRDIGDDPEFVPALPRLNLENIPWWTTVDPRARVRYAPATGPERAPTLAVLGGWGLLVLAGLAVELPPLLLALWLSMLVTAGVVLLTLLRRQLEARRTNRLFVAEHGRRVVFGLPEADEDEQAKKLTARLLEHYLTRLPGVRIFHGLAWPGSVFADVDHAVLCGNRLVLVESKKWLPGHYTADEDGTLWRNGHRFRGGATRLPEGVAGFEELLPEVEVCAALLVYPSRSGAVTTGEYSGMPAAPLTPEQFVREIGGWLAVDPVTVDREVFSIVRGQVVSE